MTDFNYIKAWFDIALPETNKLSEKQVNAWILINDECITNNLNQDSNLLIPISESIQSVLNTLSIQEMAELSRCSYFINHWKPSKANIIPKISGSWKVSNILDQELRKNFNKIHPLQIHEGTFRVTFSNKNCWLWEEFGLANEKNLKLFKECNFPFGENSLEKSAKKLKIICNDLWPEVNEVEDSTEYLNYINKEK